MAERIEVTPLEPAPGAPQPESPAHERRALREARRGGLREKRGIVEKVFLAFDNPVLRRELLTALRSNKAFILHFIFLFVLGAVVHLAWPEEDISTRSEKARTLFRIFGQGQLVLLSVLSPAFSASAMTMEKEKRALDLLLTSPIEPGTILMGKYLSSVLYLILLVFSTIPIVSVCMWLPGLDTDQIAGLYTLLVSVAISFGMIGLTCSTFFARSQVSLSITYLIVLPLALVLLVFSYTFDAFFTLNVAVWPAGLMLLAAFVMYQACLKRLRQPFDPVFKAAEEEDISTQTGLVLVRDRFPDNLLAPPKDGALLPDSSNPMYQKEIRSEIFGRGTLFLRLIIQISMFLSVVFLTFLYLKKEHVFVDYLVVFTMLVAPAFACNTFTQERERGTLDLLLTTLLRPHHVVSGKFLACARLSVFLTALVGVTLLFYLLVGGNSPNVSGLAGFGERALYFGVYLTILLATIVFETALGMFFSLISRSTLQSMIMTYSVILLFFGVPMAVKALLYLTMPSERLPEESIAWACFTSPFEAVGSVTWKTIGTTVTKKPTTIWPAYLGFAATMSAILLGYVYASFERWATKTARAQ
ncbi:MAG: ABC transporter permease subunit [Planctomycetota bacterium]|nr:ABC transporter permease subunit [Planctomycetota bacterium]